MSSNMDELGNNRSPQWYRAEVDRLRAENLLFALANADREQLKGQVAKLEAANEGWRKQHLTDFAEIERLLKLQKKREAENADLRAKPRPSQRAVDMLATAKVAAEREALFHANEALKAKLAWFEEAWELMQALVDALEESNDFDYIVENQLRPLREHIKAKPSEGTHE